MRTPTRDRILDAATDLFGTRGVDAVSLDVIAAEVGVAKQTLLYWFPSKDDLVQAVLVAAAHELSVMIEAAVRAANDDPLDRIEAVIRAVFRPAVRRPALLGLVREVSRLPSATGGSVGRRPQPAGRSSSRLPAAARWMPVACDVPIRGWSPRSVTRRSRASPPSPRRCGSLAGSHRPRACGSFETSSSHSSAPPWPPDPNPHRTRSVRRSFVSVCVLRRCRPWRSTARRTSSSMSSE